MLLLTSYWTHRKSSVDKLKGESFPISDQQDEAEEKLSSETNIWLMPSPCAAAIVVGALVESKFDDDDKSNYPGVMIAV